MAGCVEGGQLLVVAREAFFADGVDQLSFERGDLIACAAADGAWLSGSRVDARTSRVTSSVGRFPASHVVCLEGQIADAITDLKARLPEEISLSKNEAVQIVDCADAMWWTVQSLETGARGNCPRGFLAVRVPAKDSSTSTSQTSAQQPEIVYNAQETTPVYVDPPTEPHACVLYNFAAENDGELSITEGQWVRLLRHLDAGWSEGELDGGRRGLFPTAFVRVVVDCPPVDDSQLTRAASPAPGGGMGNKADSGYLSTCAAAAAAAAADLPQRTVAFDFDAPQLGDLRARLGDRLSVLGVRGADGDWVEAENTRTGERGIIPLVFLDDDVDAVRWRQSPAAADDSRSLDTLPSVTARAENDATAAQVERLSLGSGFDSDVGTPGIWPDSPSSQVFDFDEESHPSPPPPPPLPAAAPKVEETAARSGEQRARVAAELMSSEKVYLRDLELAQRVLSGSGPPLIDAEVLLAGFPSAANLSRNLIRLLEIQTGKPADEQQIGSCIVELSSQFKTVFYQFLDCCVESMALFKKYQGDDQSNGVLERCLRDMLLAGSTSIDMSTVLCRPIHRIMKYPVFLHELIQSTPVNHCDTSKLHEALDLTVEINQAINESKRRSEIVQKYCKDSEVPLVSRFSMHSLMKKSSRFSVRLTSTLGITQLARDERFEQAETELRAVAKQTRTTARSSEQWCVQLSRFVEQRSSLAAARRQLCAAAAADAVCEAAVAWRRLHDTLLPQVLAAVDSKVLKPLRRLLKSFDGPEKLIAKRRDKLLDYEAAVHKLKGSAADAPNKLQAAQEHERLAKAEYEALNGQLVDDLPKLGLLARDVLRHCQRAWLAERRAFADQLHKLFKPLQEVAPKKFSNEAIVAEFEAKHRAALTALHRLTAPPPRKAALLSASSAFAGVGATAAVAAVNAEGTFKSYVTDSQAVVATPPRDQLRQTDAARSRLRDNYADHLLFTVCESDDEKAVEKLPLPLRRGDVVAVLVRKDPMGRDDKWYCDNGVAKGFVNRRQLRPIDSSSRMSAASPLVGPSSPPQASLIDFGGVAPQPSGERPPSHVEELLSLNLSFPATAPAASTATLGTPWSAPAKTCAAVASPSEATDAHFVDLLASVKRELRAASAARARRSASPSVPRRPHYERVPSGEPTEHRRPVRRAPPPPPTASADEAADEDAAPVLEYFSAAFDFTATVADKELSISRGQLLAVLGRSDAAGNAEWWLAQDDSGEIGYVPANYLEPL